MVAPSTPNLSASSDCDRGERALAVMAIVIQLAWLTPKYFNLRSTAWRQDREVLCSASLNRSSRSFIQRALMVSHLSNISGSLTGCESSTRFATRLSRVGTEAMLAAHGPACS